MADQDLKHDASGYQRGCRCNDCRTGHRKRIAEGRSKAKGMTTPATPTDDRELGPIEQSVTDELDWIREQSEADWPETTEHLALKLARAIDDLPATDAFRLPSMIGRLTDLLDRLAKSNAPTEGASPRTDFSSLAIPE